MTIDMTTGSPVKRILTFLFPILLGNLLQQFYSLADSMIVSRFLGVQAFAGVSATGSVNFLIMGFIWGITAGCTIPISQEFGAANYERMRRNFANAIYLLLVASLLLGTATALLTPQIMRLIGTPEDIFDYAVTYIRIIFIGIPASLMYNLSAGAMRAVGNGRTPLIMLIISSVLNIALDYLFVVPWDMGIAGAAIATILSQFISGLLCVYIIFSRDNVLKIRKNEWTLIPGVIAKLLKLGIPMGLQFSITAVGSIMMQSAVNSLGSSAVAAIGAGAKVQFVFATPVEALGTTMATYCGQNIGAKRTDRIRKGVREMTLIMMAYWIIAYVAQRFCGRTLVELFIGKEDAKLTEDTLYYLEFVLKFLFLLGIILIYRNAIQGLGYSQAAMFAGVMELVGRAFVAFVLVQKMGYPGACIANPMAWLCGDVLLLPMYFRVIKKQEKLLGTAKNGHEA